MYLTASWPRRASHGRSDKHKRRKWSFPARDKPRRNGTSASRSPAGGRAICARFLSRRQGTEAAGGRLAGRRGQALADRAAPGVHANWLQEVAHRRGTTVPSSAPTSRRLRDMAAVTACRGGHRSGTSWRQPRSRGRTCVTSRVTSVSILRDQPTRTQEAARWPVPAPLALLRG